MQFDASTSTDPDAGDALTFAWSFGDGGTTTGTIASHTYADNGTYTMTLTATDSFGAASTASSIVTVSNAAPVITAVNVPANGETGQQLTISGTFTDAGTADTHSATIAWGDGNTSTVAGAGGAFSGTHTYATPGTYTVAVTLSDDDGGSNSATGQTPIIVNNLLNALGPARLWLGLKNSDAVGLRVDLRAEVLLNGNVVGSGEINYVATGSSGFNSALLNTIQLALAAPVVVSVGAQLSFRASVRRTCFGGGHNSGAVRLWYNGQPIDTGSTRDAGSRFAATIAQTSSDYFLRENSALLTSAGASRQFVDANVNSSVACPARQFTPLGTWSITMN